MDQAPTVALEIIGKVQDSRINNIDISHKDIRCKEGTLRIYINFKTNQVIIECKDWNK